MKQARKLLEKIDRKKQALLKTDSEHLKKDYSKSIKSDLKELKDYCKFKGLDFEELTRGTT